MLLVAYLANTKTKKYDSKPGTLVLIWEYSARAIQWIPTWQGLDDFQKSLHPILVLWTKVALALEGLNPISNPPFIRSSNTFSQSSVTLSMISTFCCMKTQIVIIFKLLKKLSLIIFFSSIKHLVTLQAWEFRGCLNLISQM